MPNAVDNFSAFYRQVSTYPSAPVVPQPALPAGNTPAYNPYASTYVPDPNRPAVNPQPWNNPNYPGTPPYVPAPTQTYPTYPTPTYPTQPTYPTYPTQTYPTSYPSTYPTQYPSYPNGYMTGPGPITAVSGSLRGVIKDKGYDKFVQNTAPIIDQAIPIIGGIISLFSGNKAQNPNQPMATTGTYGPSLTPVPANPYPASYPTSYPTVPTYPTQTYPTPYPSSYPTAYPTMGQAPNYGTASNDLGTQIQQGVQAFGGIFQAIGGLFK